jgi:hypothetical protein
MTGKPPCLITPSNKEETMMSKVDANTMLTCVDVEIGGTHALKKASTGFELLLDYVPCIIQDEDDDSSSKAPVFKDEAPVQELVKKVESIPIIPPTHLQISQSESYFDDSKPPPMAIAASTSDTDDDTDEILDGPKERSHTDPFASREGRTLCWRNINMTLVRY